MKVHAAAAVVLWVVAAGCSRAPAADSAAKPAPPAKVEHPRTEADLTSVTLSPEAIKRIGIESAPATHEQVFATRTLGGEVAVPEGRSVAVTAPVAGTLTPINAMTAGSHVRKGQPLFRLIPLAAGERDQRIEAERAVSAAEAEEQSASQRLARLEGLLKDGAASIKAVEEARAQQRVAAAALVAARERLKSLNRNPIGAQGDLTLVAPLDGVLQSVAVAQGQTVAAAAPLFEVAQMDTLWVRVPVYAGDLSQMETTQPATLVTLDPSAPPRQLRRVTAPLKADPGAASVDLFYEVVGASGALRPGQRISVDVPLRTSEKGLVVPESAVVYDVHGSTWVYVEQGSGTYVRRRVEAARHVGGKVVIARGLTEGTRVVTRGAAELFGTEFGIGK